MLSKDAVNLQENTNAGVRYQSCKTYFPKKTSRGLLLEKVYEEDYQWNVMLILTFLLISTRKMFFWICRSLTFRFYLCYTLSKFLYFAFWVNCSSLNIMQPVFTCLQLSKYNVACIYLFKVNNGNTRTMREVRSKLRMKTPVFQCVYF